MAAPSGILDFSREDILHEADIQEVEYYLFCYAKQVAIVGAIDTARDLVTLFHRCSVTSSYDHFPEHFVLAWHESGRWPEGSSEKSRSQALLDRTREINDRCCWGGCEDTTVQDQLRTLDGAGLEACLDCDALDIPVPIERLVKALKSSLGSAQQSFVASSPTTERERSEDGHTTRPKDQGESGWIDVMALDQGSYDILQHIVARWGERNLVETLMRAERLWPLFITGTVAKAMGMRRTQLDRKAAEILDAFTQRLENPLAKTALSGKSLREILEVADESSTRGAAAIAYFDKCRMPGEDYGTGPGTLFQRPAGDGTIAALESRLNCTLPDDFKTFLQISNGFYFGDREWPKGVFNGYFPDPGIYSSDMIRWDTDICSRKGFQLLQIPIEMEWANVESIDENRVRRITALPAFDRVLVIGRLDVFDLWLVPPEKVAEARKAYYGIHSRGDEKQQRIIERAIEAFSGGGEAFDNIEWACVRVSMGGGPHVACYPSFTRYLEIAAAKSLRASQKEEAKMPRS